MSRKSRVRLAALALLALPHAGCMEMGAGQGQPKLPLEPGIYAGTLVMTGEGRTYYSDGSVLKEPLYDLSFMTIVIGDDGLPAPDPRGLVFQLGALTIEFYPVGASIGENGVTATYDMLAGIFFDDGSVVFLDGAGTDTILRAGEDSIRFSRVWFLVSLDGTLQLDMVLEGELFE